MPIWRALILFTVIFGGCCPPIKPTPDEVRALAASELPAGSSDVDVIRFFRAHGFSWDNRPRPNWQWSDNPEGPYLQPDQTSMQGSRRIGGCESTKAIAIMLVTFDEHRRVESVKVHGAAMLP